MSRLVDRVVVSLALASLWGCGARTGLEAPTPVPIDASRDTGPDTGAPPPPTDAGRDSGPDTGPAVVIPDLFVVVTADNSYRFGFGDALGLRSTFGAAEATTACEIFCCSTPCTTSAECAGVACGPLGACEDDLGAEVYVVPEGAVTGADFLYVIAWSDDSVTQGLMVDVRDPSGRVLSRSGDRGWSVCATGRDYDRDGPGDDEVAEWLARCDRADTPSGGWVGSESVNPPRLAVGERNDGDDGEFPIVCGAPGSSDSPTPETAWVWFDGGSGPPFTTPQPEFLLFRVSTRDILR